MKKLIYLSIAIFASIIIFNSCELENQNFDESLLIGTWKSGTEYYKYNDNGTGGTWDTGEDVTEEEAQAFTWSLIGAELTQIHVLEIGGSVPKIYTVLQLTSSTLKYEDDFGKMSTYTKVN